MVVEVMTPSEGLVTTVTASTTVIYTLVALDTFFLGGGVLRILSSGACFCCGFVVDGFADEHGNLFMSGALSVTLLSELAKSEEG